MLTTDIYDTMHLTMPPDLGAASSLSVLLLAVVAVLLSFYGKLTRNAERFATITARLELGQDPAAVLAEYQLDAARWQEVQATWLARVGPTADAFAANMLRGQLHALTLQAKAAYGRAR